MLPGGKRARTANAAVPADDMGPAASETASVASPAGPSPGAELADANSISDTVSRSESTSSNDETSSGSSSSDTAAPPPRKKRSRKTTKQPHSDKGATIDSLKLKHAPIKSKMPPPPRGLKLPTVDSTTLRHLANRKKVVSVDAVLAPLPCADGPTTSAQATATAGDYMHAVSIIVAYRAYFFPELAVQVGHVPGVAPRSGGGPERGRD